jgi:putative ABC transport system permease protein
MLVPLLVGVAVLAALAVHDLLRRPTLRRLALRNVARRRGEALLVTVGCVLGAAIVTSSLLVGDSLRASVRDVARTQLGPVDEIVSLPLDRLDAATRALDPLPAEVAGVVPAVRAPGVAVAGGAARRAGPHAQVIEVGFEAARRLGGDPALTGLAGAGPTPRPGEAVIDDDVARSIGAGPDARFTVIAAGGRIQLRVRQVVPRVGIAGLAGDGMEETANIFVAPGTLGRLAGGADRAARPPEAMLLVSNGGGIFGGVERTDAVSAAVADRLGAIEAASVSPVKRDLLEVADEAGASFTSIFAAIGAVAVLAGVLLLVNVFVMLSEERKPELGTLRALGLRRHHVVRAFGIEGGIYALLGGILGAVVGVGVGRVVVEVAARIFDSAGEDVSVRFSAPLASVAAGFAIGSGISLLTVWITSARIARLNVIRAIRDQPAPPWRGSRRRLRALGAAGVLLGTALTAGGVAGGAWAPALFGPPLAALAAVALLAGGVRPRRLATFAALGSLAWALSCYMVLPKAFEAAGVSGFVAQGIVATAATVALLAVHSEHWTRLGSALGHRRGGLSAHLGLAYPLARPFRTAMQMAMFGLVVFGLVFLAVLSHLFSSQAPRYIDEVGAGYEIVLDSSAGNPASPSRIAGQPGVAGVAPLVRALPEFSTPRHPELDRWYLTGYDARLLARGTPGLAERDPRFPDDRAVFEAVLRSPDLAVVPDWFLQEGGGTPEGVVEVGEWLTVRNPATGSTRRLKVAGIVGGDWALAGVMVGATAARELLGGDAVASRAMVAVAPGEDPDEVAARLTGRLV